LLGIDAAAAVRAVCVPIMSIACACARCTIATTGMAGMAGKKSGHDTGYLD
jgi:hypothetical protein